MGSARVRAVLGAALLVAALAWPAMAHLQDGDAGGLDPAEKLPSTIRGELPLPHRTVLGVVVGRDSLADVQARLGQALQFTPVGSVDVVAVCYALDDEQGSVVVFQADPQDPHAVVLIAHATRRSSLGGMARHCQRTAPWASPPATPQAWPWVCHTMISSHDSCIGLPKTIPAPPGSISTTWWKREWIRARGPTASCSRESGSAPVQGEPWLFRSIASIADATAKLVAARERLLAGFPASPTCQWHAACT